MTNGWRYPKVNFAMNKFCFIDPDADVTNYIGSMKALEARYPETVFVYATLPVTTDADEVNAARNGFNNYLRGWVATNNRVLFDVADIESHDTAGVAYVFTNGGRVCQRLYPGFTTDGGHLDDAGGVGRQQAAKGFYALASALLGVDRDGDGMTDGAELIAGTCPTGATSVLRFTSASNAAANVIRLQWPAASNRFYALDRMTNLVTLAGLTNLLTNAPGTPPLNTYTGAVGNAGSVFYRLSVRQ